MIKPKTFISSAIIAASSVFYSADAAIAEQRNQRTFLARFNCGRVIGEIIIYDFGDKRLGKHPGIIDAPRLKLRGYPIIMNVGGNWWSAEGYEVSIYRGAKGHFARTKIGKNEKFFNGREVRCQERLPRIHWNEDGWYW